MAGGPLMRPEVLPHDYRDTESPGGSGIGMLAAAAVLLGLLPVAVVLLRLLPTYMMHARFLLFYAPIVCLLLLGYLISVREVAARWLFGDLLDAMDTPDPYYQEAASLRAGGRTLQKVAVNILPVLLIGLSFFCMSRYVSRFNESLTLATDVLVARIPLPPRDSLGAAAPPSPESGASPADTVARPSAEPAYDPAREAAERLAIVRSLPGLASDPDPFRTYTLESASIGDIPHLTELTALYLGAILAPLAALFLVLLKEHTRRELGVSEREAVGGRPDEPLIPATEGGSSADR